MNEGLSASSSIEQFIKSEEGLKLTPYEDAGGYSIGYGHHFFDPKQYTKITKEEAEELFDHDINEIEYNVKRLVKIPLNQDMFDALVSLVYNVGPTSFAKSHLLDDINHYRFKSALKNFSDWTGGGTLAKRRGGEISRWLNGINQIPKYKKILSGKHAVNDKASIIKLSEKFYKLSLSKKF